MEKPTEDTTPGACLKRSAFTCSAVAADPQIAGQEQGLQAAHDLLKQGVRDHEDLLETVQKQLAILVGLDRQCDAVVKAFELQLYGAVNKNRKDPLYVRYFPFGLRDVTEADMRTEEPVKVEEIIKALAEDAGKPVIGALATDFLPKLTAALAAVEGGDTKLTAAEQDAAYAVSKTLPGLVVDWTGAYVKLHGAIEAAFPYDAPRVESYFQPFRKTRKKPGKNTGAPDGAPQGTDTGKSIGGNATVPVPGGGGAGTGG
jgi:hypothetical protein